MSIWTDLALDELHAADAWPVLTTPPAEGWRDVPRFEGLYRVSSRGRVESVRTGCPMAETDGAVRLTDPHRHQRWFKVADLVEAAFGSVAAK